MTTIGLALSGGGFRATVYHLGVIRFLRDAGALQQVTHVASVSGGSILAAHLVLNWDRYTGDDKEFEAATEEIVNFLQFDLRNHIVRRLPLQWPFRMLSKFSFLNRDDFTPNAILQRYYRDYLYGDRCLYELPEKPMLHILATSVSKGALSAFNRDGLFIQQRAVQGKRDFEHIPGKMAGIPQVVGASSAFPGFFPPVKITAADLGVRDGQFPTEYFTDGGVYDNLGLRAFSWLKHNDIDFDHIIVSDAGKPFQILSDASLGFVGQSVRASDILWDRVWQLERENFGTQKGFLFLPITELVDPAEDPHALQPVVQAEVQSIRTDLDRFSDEEINALAQHGYEVARKLCKKSGVVAESQIPETTPWAPIPAVDSTTLEPPKEHSPEPSQVTLLSRKLRSSAQRRVWSTLLDWRDWTSYFYLAVAFVLLIYAPLQVYDLYRKSQLQGLIIDSIASGDPDIHLILDLAMQDPTEDWVNADVRSKPQPTEMDFAGVEIMSHSRIYDLRRWYPNAATDEDKGHIYVRDRITLKLLESYQGDGHIVFSFPTRRATGIAFRQPQNGLQAIISQVSKSTMKDGRERTVYELEYDLSQFARGEQIDLELELLAIVPNTYRAAFETHAKTDLISVWMLFPEDRPYRTYSLVSYPADRSQAPQTMNNRYSIDHPYGSLIGWSVVNPDEDHIYECRWTTK